MFLHIGGSQIVFDYELVGIFDINLADYAEKPARDRLNLPEISLSGGYKDKPKSFILTDKYLYLSPIAPQTLARRFKNRSKS
jgi:hypothetical protein